MVGFEQAITYSKPLHIAFDDKVPPLRCKEMAYKNYVKTMYGGVVRCELVRSSARNIVCQDLVLSLLLLIVLQA